MARHDTGSRSRILEAAFACFSERGYDRTTTARICEAAQVSSGTFFHHFPTKPAVLAALLEKGGEQTRAVMDDAVARSGQDALAGLDHWCGHVLEEAADPELRGFVTMLATAPDDERVRGALRGEAELQRAGLVSILRSGQQQGVVRPDTEADQLARWLTILADGLITHVVEADGSVVDDLRLQFPEMIHRWVAPQPGD